MPIVMFRITENNVSVNKVTLVIPMSDAVNPQEVHVNQTLVVSHK